MFRSFPWLLALFAVMAVFVGSLIFGFQRLRAPDDQLASEVALAGILAGILVGVGGLLYLMLGPIRRDAKLMASTLELRKKQQEADQRLTSVVDNSSSAIVLKDLDGRFLLANRRFSEWYDAPADGLSSRTYIGLFPPDLANSLMDDDRKVVESGRTLEREIEVPFADGSTHVILTTSFPVMGPDGRTYGVGTVNTDVTERNQIRETLSESEARLRQAVELAGLGYWVWDAVGGHCLHCSEGHARIHGVSVGDYVAKLSAPGGATSFIHPDDMETFVAAMKALRRGRKIEMEYRIARPDGEVRHIHEIARPVFDKDGRVFQEYGIIQDVTEQKQADERLHQAQKLEAVGQLTGGVAHDFNNLLAVVQGNAEFIADQAGGSDQHTQAILRASERGAELTQRLLAFSRRQALHPRTIDLTLLVAGLAGLLERTLGETFEIVTDWPEDLWPALADPGQVENAVLNLALNARDAMPDGGRLTIECRNVRLTQDDAAKTEEALPGDYVQLTVSDQGVGMSPYVAKHAFEPFFTTKEVGQGSGLGLSMVYGFAQQSGGFVTIDSALGEGTRMKVNLPRSQENVESKGRDETKQAARGRNEVVLVVEDEAEVRTLTVQALNRLGYHAIEASDAKSARKILDRDEPIDLILSDVVLPGGVSGPELAREAKIRRPDVKVVFMSGYTAMPAEESDDRLTDEVLLNKPFHRQELAEAVRQALG